MPRKKKKSIDPQEYSAFIQGLEIRQVFLLRASSERLSFPEPDAKLSFDFPEATAELARFDDKSGFIACLQYTVDLMSKVDDAESQRFASISVSFEAIYNTKTPITDEIFETFKDINLKMNIWPYVREYVQSATMKMGLPGLILPHLKVL
jgi:preprotein translocase subunit SecB